MIRYSVLLFNNVSILSFCSIDSGNFHPDGNGNFQAAKIVLVAGFYFKT
jgi:hypothetical protein